ncbi:hypothetical protein [Dictyobacter aurantiacus]|uniref:Uncharacterized protein n=1 Tax=Dictyobacter aurantiacus TaxID=1936993 RepID=A0A401ZR55_9CHLR|nr:hypothetical protein [Dictyobacter aurantiacus]GCE09398.1 hypothetical protein KDAU_67270 [Dictyobacter aurantiacus]
MAESNDAQKSQQLWPMQRFPRRAFLERAGATTAALAIGGSLVFTGTGKAHAQGTQPLPPVPDIQPATISLTTFAPDEQRFAPHLATLSYIANSVDDQHAATYGYINTLYRGGSGVPGNTRQQEPALVMAYFYSVKRPWNPYYGNTALRQRLEAAFSYWLTLQHDDGSFPEYTPDEHSLAATGFSLFHFSLALRYLDQGPGIDATLYDQVVNALRRATDWLLDPNNPIPWVNGLKFSNQINGGLLGVTNLLPRFRDPALEARLLERQRFFHANAQSQAGFYFEANEVDHPYSFQVLSPMLALRYEALPYADELQMHQQFFDWLQYNFLWEPDGAGFLIDESICDRYGFPYQLASPGDTSKDDANLLWPRYIPQAAAYRPTAQERDAARQAWAQGSWSNIKPYPQCQYMDMTNFNLPFFRESEPDSREKEAAIASLAYMRQQRFTEYRVDTPRDFEFLFVRRPSYYMGMALGKGTAPQLPKRNGLSFLWHPQMGSLIHSRNLVNDLVWSTAVGTPGTSTFQMDAANFLNATYFHGQSTHPVDPAHLGAGEAFTVHYTTPDQRFARDVFFTDSHLEISTQVSGNFNERLPLVLKPDDQISWIGSIDHPTFGVQSQQTQATGFSLARNGHTMTISWGDTPLAASLTASTYSFFADKQRTLYLLTLSTQNQLNYTITIE